MADVPELTDSNFDAEVLQVSEPVLVDFWGPGCQPCMRMVPIVEALAAQYSGSVKVRKLNTAENLQTAQNYEVFGLPTFLIFKDGEVVNRFLGHQSKEKLQEALDAAKG